MNKKFMLFLLILSMSFITSSFAYNSSYTNISLENNGWCVNYTVTFKIYNQSQFEDKNMYISKHLSFQNISGASVTIYGGPFNSFPILKSTTSNLTGQFNYTFNSSNNYLIKIVPTQIHFNSYYKTLLISSCPSSINTTTLNLTNKSINQSLNKSINTSSLNKIINLTLNQSLNPTNKSINKTVIISKIITKSKSIKKYSKPIDLTKIFGISIFIILLAILMFFLTKNNKHKREIIDIHKEPLSVSQTYTNALNYVNNYKQNYTKQQIRDALINSKIPENIIEEVFNQIYR